MPGSIFQHESKRRQKYRSLESFCFLCRNPRCPNMWRESPGTRSGVLATPLGKEQGKYWPKPKMCNLAMIRSSSLPCRKSPPLFPGHWHTGGALIAGAREASWAAGLSILDEEQKHLKRVKMIGLGGFLRGLSHSLFVVLSSSLGRLYYAMGKPRKLSVSVATLSWPCYWHCVKDFGTVLAASLLRLFLSPCAVYAPVTHSCLHDNCRDTEGKYLCGRTYYVAVSLFIFIFLIRLLRGCWSSCFAFVQFLLPQPGLKGSQKFSGFFQNGSPFMTSMYSGSLLKWLSIHISPIQFTPCVLHECTHIEGALHYVMLQNMTNVPLLAMKILWWSDFRR